MEQTSYFHILKKHWHWSVPLFFWVVFTPFSAMLDLSIANSVFYRLYSDIPSDTYGFFSTPFFDFVYLWGVLPAQVLGVLATLCLIGSIWKPSFARYRSICLILSLTLAIGSGFITHFALKESWGRPRPRQVVDFGGQQSFKAYYQPQFKNTPEPSKSFPSGHSTCGFYFFCLYFIGKRLSNKTLAIAGITTGFALGGLLSLARIVQGGHFISDILVSGLIMWYTAYFLDYFIFQAQTTSTLRNKIFTADDIGLQTAAHQA